MDRIEEYLGDRLRGRRVPEDLRRLIEMQLDGELGDDRVQPFWEIRVLAPGEVHSLERDTESHEEDPHPEEVRANNRAIEGVLAHIAPVIDGFNGDLWGYWLHPDEPPRAEPLVVKLDTEGQFNIMSGASLVEAMIFDFAGEEDIAEIAEYCDRHGIPLVARSLDDVPAVKPVVSPAVLHEKLYKRAHPNHTRPAWVDEPGAVPDVAPIGARADDPRVRRALARYGLDEDALPAIQAADVGEGEVVLSAGRCCAEFEFHREDETRWFLHQMRFFDQRGDKPACSVVPFGLDMNETREQCWARLGEPAWKSPVIAIDRWTFGRVHLHVTYGKSDKPSTVRCRPSAP